MGPDFKDRPFGASSNTLIVELPKFVLDDRGMYSVNGDDACTACGKQTLTCPPGDYVKCQSCNAVMLHLGKVPAHDCITPSGRVNMHGKYGTMRDGKWICAFCNKPR